MPIENVRSRTIASKPLTPALSSNIRTRPAHGVTPRLAGAAITSPSAANIQRSLRQQTLSPERSSEDGVLSLNANITPRSGARGSRFDTESPSTPDATARPRASDDSVSVAEDVQNSNYGLGISSPVHTPTQPKARSGEHLSYLPMASNRRISGGSSVSSVKDESKFFRADDIRSPNMRPGPIRAKTTYSTSIVSPRIPPEKPTSQDKEKPAKFFHASSATDQQRDRQSRPTLAMKLSAASTATQSTRSLPALRANAEAKIHVDSTPASASGDVESTVSAISTTKPKIRSAEGKDISKSSVLDRRRSSSLNIQPVVIAAEKGHRKSLSATSTLILESQAEDVVNDLTQPLQASEHAPTLCDIPREIESFFSPTPAVPVIAERADIGLSSSTAKDPIASVPLSSNPPMRPRHARGSSEATALQPVTKEQIEAANSARRERKVLDLEISNSSLLAINRTLEKELRKQNTELRRFRRLSRSGRLSLAPSNRIVSTATVLTLSTLDEGDMDSTLHSTSPTTSDPGSIDDDDDTISDEGSSFTESSDALRRRARDEKRLMQDLQRHQQILLDSQKLTQSIQRCLNSTEELIKEGNKALAYQVEETDIQIGGKILSHDDDEALSEVDFDEYKGTMTAPRQGLLSPTVTKDALEEAAMWANGIQALDGNAEGGSRYPMSEQRTTESPSPTMQLSPVLLPAG